MEYDQNQNDVRFRYRHNPPLIYGDTAGAPDPYATSPYDGLFSIEPTNQQLRLDTAAEMSSFAPMGMRNFAQHYSPVVDSGFGHQDLTFWDNLALESLLPGRSFAEAQSIQIGHESIPRTSQIGTASLQYPYVFEHQFSDIQQVGLLPAQFLGGSHNDQVIWNGDQVGLVGMDEAVLATDQGHRGESWGMSQNLQNNLRGCVSQNTLQLPSYDAGESTWEDEIDPGPPKASHPRRRRRTGPKRSFLRYRRFDPKKILGTEIHESDGEFAVLDSNVRAPNSYVLSSDTTARTRERKGNACLKCMIAKKRCEKEDELETRCRRCLLLPICSSTKSFLEPWKLPDLNTETRSDQSHNAILNNSVTIPKLFRASIFVSYGSGKLGIPLRCKVTEIQSNLDYQPRITFIWQNPANARLDKNCLQKGRLKNFIIPDGRTPSAELLLKWAVDSVIKLPSGIVEEYYGPLFEFSVEYASLGTHPLSNLVALALIHTVIYNVCHSRMMIVFDCNLQAPNSVPDRLRDQICGPLLQIFNTTGQEIRRMIKKALRSRSKKESLAFYVTLCLLILTYEHISGQKLTSLDYLASQGQDAKSDWKKIQKNLIDLRAVQECLFENMPNLDDKEFDLSWKGNGINEDDHKLEEALSKLRIAMPKQRIPKIRQESIIAQILAPELFEYHDRKQYGQWPTTETGTISTNKRLDIDNMSATDTGLGSGDEISLPSVGQVLKHPNQMFEK